MKTNKIMDSIDRELCGVNVRQRTKDEYLCLNDIIYIINNTRMQNRENLINFSYFMQLQNIKDFLIELEKEVGVKPYHQIRKGGLGWVHPFFAIKILTHYNPKFEVQVYKWLWDYLIQNRIKSSDSYNAMCGVLWKYSIRKDLFHKNIKLLCKKIQEKVGCDDWNKATNSQLQARDKLHELITDFTCSFQNGQQGIQCAFKVFDERYSSKMLIEDKSNIEL